MKFLFEMNPDRQKKATDARFAHPWPLLRRMIVSQ